MIASIVTSGYGPAATIALVVLSGYAPIPPPAIEPVAEPFAVRELIADCPIYFGVSPGWLS